MNTRQNFRIGAFLTALGVAGSLGLAGCSDETTTTNSAAPTPATAGARGPITYALGKLDTELLAPIVDKWNQAHPDEQVTMKELAGEAGDQRDFLVQNLQAGSDDIDVMALDVIWTAEFAANQWIAPLEGDLAVDTSKLLKPTVDSATYLGTLYAMPQNTNGQLLFRNTKIVPTAPKNFAELTDSCELARDKNVECLTLQLKQYEGLTVNAAGFIEGWGGHILNEDGSPAVATDEAKAGMQALVDAYKDGVIAKNSTSTTEQETHLGFLAGETAYAINWPYMYDMAQDNDSTVAGRVEVQPLVGKSGVGVSTLGGLNNGINVNSKHKETAKDFIEFITSAENQSYFAEKSFPPVLASIYDDADLIAKYPYLPALKISLENAVPRPASPFYPAISKAIQDNAYAALMDGKSVDDAARDMEAAIRAAG
ncbi:ABC transporter substrate-binding protein [Corynebacterium sp. ES2794-CONJ1]|uniref:ABC transporter substrate-binding protein n=1 Tax=Corynebacterium sp. ES2794-CONJ1 TaxID=2980553 RepID=UPI0021D8E3C0|nr:ABC transporter substrate-binding protein [Corynebacterium sp. ES2794-CONJ1]MCU9518796.1 ABC transporter substrate-binding protein [Corynebacterium sp. ES2794-CONJ1]